MTNNACKLLDSPDTRKDIQIGYSTALLRYIAIDMEGNIVAKTGKCHQGRPFPQNVCKCEEEK